MDVAGGAFSRADGAVHVAVPEGRRLGAPRRVPLHVAVRAHVPREERGSPGNRTIDMLIVVDETGTQQE